MNRTSGTDPIGRRAGGLPALRATMRQALVQVVAAQLAQPMRSRGMGAMGSKRLNSPGASGFNPTRPHPPHWFMNLRTDGWG